MEKNKKIISNRKELKKTYFMVILSIIILIVSVFVLIFSYFTQKDTPIFIKNYDIFFQVDQGRAGFDLNNTILTFGIIPQGGEGVRKIDVINNYDFPIKTKFFISENLAPYSIFPDEIILEKGEKKVIELSIKMPVDAEIKNYTGKFRMEFYKLS